MAKTSMVNRETKRAKLVKKFAARREALKEYTITEMIGMYRKA